MFFLGSAFVSGLYMLDSSPSPSIDANALTITGAIFDELYITHDELEYDTDIPTVWDYNTVMHAYFNETLLAGNINFYINNTNSLRLKRRKVGDLRWDTLYEQMVVNASSFLFSWHDYTARSKQAYQYAIVPMLAGVESDLFSQEVTTDFHGLIITDRESVYSAHMDIDVSMQRNRPSSIVNTINRKYPFVISNGMNNYESGKVSALFTEIDTVNCTWDFENAYEYRRGLKDFLYNGASKIIKHEDGRMWLANITSPQISDSQDGHQHLVHSSFEFTEIGDCEDTLDLFANNFIDMDGV